MFDQRLPDKFLLPSLDSTSKSQLAIGEFKSIIWSTVDLTKPRSILKRGTYDHEGVVRAESVVAFEYEGVLSHEEESDVNQGVD